MLRKRQCHPLLLSCLWANHKFNTQDMMPLLLQDHGMTLPIIHLPGSSQFSFHQPHSCPPAELKYPTAYGGHRSEPGCNPAPPGSIQACQGHSPCPPDCLRARTPSPSQDTMGHAQQSPTSQVRTQVSLRGSRSPWRTSYHMMQPSCLNTKCWLITCN